MVNFFSEVGHLLTEVNFFGWEGQLFIVVIALLIAFAFSHKLKENSLVFTMIYAIFTFIGVATWYWLLILISVISIITNIQSDE